MIYSIDRTQGFMVDCAPNYGQVAANHDIFGPISGTALLIDATSTSGVRQVSEDLWKDAKKRHCDSRANWRDLLNKYVQPHH